MLQYDVQIHELASSDLDHIVECIKSRSPDGARRWLRVRGSGQPPLAGLADNVSFQLLAEGFALFVETDQILHMVADKPYWRSNRQRGSCWLG